MRVRYIVALLVVVLMLGCATQQPTTPPASTQPETPAETPAAAPAETPPALPETPATPEAPAEVKGDIVITKAGFDPAEMTVKVGTTLAIKSAEGNHKLTVSGTTTPIIEEGSAYDVTFDKVGKIRLFDINTKKSAYITVTEQGAEAAAPEAGQVTQ